jgi:hypothetical protein
LPIQHYERSFRSVTQPVGELATCGNNERFTYPIQSDLVGAAKA